MVVVEAACFPNAASETCQERVIRVSITIPGRHCVLLLLLLLDRNETTKVDGSVPSCAMYKSYSDRQNRVHSLRRNGISVHAVTDDTTCENIISFIGTHTLSNHSHVRTHRTVTSWATIEAEERIITWRSISISMNNKVISQIEMRSRESSWCCYSPSSRRRQQQQQQHRRAENFVLHRQVSVERAHDRHLCRTRMTTVHLSLSTGSNVPTNGQQNMNR